MPTFNGHGHWLMRNDIFINPYKKFSFSGKPFKTLFIEWQKSMILNLVGNHCPFHIKTLSWRTIWQLTVHDSSRNVETVASRGNIILKFIHNSIEISLTSRTCWSRPHIREKSLALDTNCPAFWKINTSCCCIVYFSHHYIIF